MRSEADNKKSLKTGKLTDEALWNPPTARAEVSYRPVPSTGSLADADPLPTWRLLFELSHDSSLQIVREAPRERREIAFLDS